MTHKNQKGLKGMDIVVFININKKSKSEYFHHKLQEMIDSHLRGNDKCENGKADVIINSSF